MIDPKRIPPNVRSVFRQKLDAKIEGMRTTRMSWWLHWAQLAAQLLPRRYKWFISPNQNNRGSQANEAIVDETGIVAARTCASGMMAGLTSPTRPWFRMGLHDLGNIPFGPVKDWLAEVERRMMRVLSESNFYQSLGTLYSDLATFCSADMIIYEDAEQVIRCYNPCLGEFFFGVSYRNDVDTNAREYPLTVAAIVEQFGLENCPDDVVQAFKNGGVSLTLERIIRHIIEPNTQLYIDGAEELTYIVPRLFKYREAYWVQGSADGELLQLSGFKEKPFVGARWSTTSNDPYGSAGPGMDAYGACRQLQVEQRRKAEAIDKLVRPPMVGSVSMKNEPASILPSAITYVADISTAGFKPAYQVDPHIQELTQDIAEVQQRIKEVFFVDLFMMISNLNTVRTATEIDARREEKLIQLGPVIERFENEVLDPIINRVFAIMARRGLLPPPPPGIGGADINVQYISMLAEAQNAAATGAMERLLQVIGGMVAVTPDIMDNVDTDKFVDVYSDKIKVDPQIIRTEEAVAEIRAKRQQEKEANIAAQTSLAMVGAGKTLSETDVGGGQNALQAVAQGIH